MSEGDAQIKRPAPGDVAATHRLVDEVIKIQTQDQISHNAGNANREQREKAASIAPAGNKDSIVLALDCGTGTVIKGDPPVNTRNDATQERSKNDPESTMKQPFFAAEELTERERRLTQFSGVTPEQYQKIKHEFNEHGHEPKELLVNAIKRARVLGFGESHIWSSNLELMTNSLKDLKAAGATHFAVELSQSEVDEILRTGKDSGMHHNKEEYVAMMLAARDAGLTVVGVDNRKQNNGSGQGNENRDTGMADDISAILRSDPKAKVVFVVGSAHLANEGPGVSGSPSGAAKMLKDRFGKDQVVTTFPADGSSSFQEITGNLNRPCAIETSEAPELASTAPWRDVKHGNWDIFIAYPKDQTDPYYGPYEERKQNKK